MSNPATAPAGPPRPDPDRAPSARLDPAGSGRILRLLHTLLAYGRNVVQALRQQRDPNDLPWFAVLTRIFDTTNPALITVNVIRGLLRAAALQARLGSSIASLLPFPMPEDRSAKRTAGGRRPAPRQLHPAAWAIPPGWPTGDPTLDRLPTPEEEMFAEIVAEDRDRPIGAILLDISLDLGIAPALMDPGLWDELRLAISLHGGDPAPLIARSAGLATPARDLPTAGHRPRPTGIVYPPWPAPHPQSPVPAGTGPP